MHMTSSYTAQPPGRRTNQESSRGPWTFRKPKTTGSQRVCFAWSDVGLSQFMPNTRQSVRFCPWYTVKTAIFAQKSSHSAKLVKRLNTFHAHCFTTLWNFSQMVKHQGRFCSIWFKIYSFQDPCTICCKINILDAIGRFPTKSSVSC